MLDPSSQIIVLPSTSKLTLSSLPDDALYRILKQVKSSNEIQKFRGVSKRFRRIIHNRGYGLSRPKIDSMVISFDFPQIPQNQIGKLRFPTTTATPPPSITFNINLFKSNRSIPFKQTSISTSHLKCPKQLSPEMFLSLNSTLKRFSLNSTLEFHRIVIDENFIQHFLKPFVDIKNIEKLRFFYCSFENIKVEKMIEFLNKTKCKVLEVVFCDGAEKIVNDKLLTSLPSLDSLRIQANPYQPFYNISNKTLIHWMSSSTASTSAIPSVIDLCNCQTFLTPSNLSTFLNFAYKNVLNRTVKKFISYDFGSIFSHPKDVKQFSMENSKFKFHCFQSSKNLSSIHFKSNLVNLFEINNHPPQIAMIMNLLKSTNSATINPSKSYPQKSSKFEINFILNCEIPQSFEHPSLLPPKINYSNEKSFINYNFISNNNNNYFDKKFESIFGY